MDQTNPVHTGPAQSIAVHDSAVIDLETRRNVRMLRARAGSLVTQAASLGEPLATAYRRRARELELEAFLLETRGAARAA
jgi:hypothetical protein